MANKRAILPRKQLKLAPLGKVLQQEQESFASVYFLQKLEEVVEPFDSRITFVIQSQLQGGDFTTNISPADTIAGLNAANFPVTSHELFQWLDEGTSVRKVGMPDDFDNETSPHSLFTSGVDYDREKIYFLDDPKPGLVAREFLRLIHETYLNVYRNSMASVIRFYLE